MDRTTIAQNITILGNKRATDTEKFSESFLCDEIHSNLRSLSFIHPFTDDFKHLFEKVSRYHLSLNAFFCPL